VLERDYLRRGVAEFIGTFALIFIGAGAAAFARIEVDFALANGLVILVMVSAFGFISGGHFNPAVTLGFLVTRRIAPLLPGWYWLVQFGAAACAALLLKYVFPTTVENSGSLRAVARTASPRAGVGSRPCSFFLVVVVFATAVDPRGVFSRSQASRSGSRSRSA
jgi:aquaporin Z